MKKVLSAILIAFLVLVLCVSAFAADNADISDGTIDSPEDLLLLMTTSSAWSGSYTLTKDIDMSGVSGQTPIGNASIMFTGTFDGGHHTISGMYMNLDTQYTALFGVIKGATVKNLTVDGSFTSTATHTAGLIGYAENSVIENCHNKATVSGTGYVGGVVGYCYKVKSLTNCYNSGDVIATASDVGGITGLINGITDMSHCWSTGKIIYNNKNVGGLIGRTAGTIKVTNCYTNTALVLASGSSYTPASNVIRAFCGYPQSKNFTACYFGTAAVEGNACTGITVYTADSYATLDGGSGNWVQGNNGPELKSFHVCDDPDEDGKCACGAIMGDEHICTVVSYIDNNNGTHIGVCDCGETVGEAVECTMQEIADSAVAPTCNTAGKKADTKCALCGYIVNGDEISATGEHTPGEYVVNSDGTHSVNCANCGISIVANEAHDLQGIGLCSVCGYSEAFDSEVGTAAELVRLMYDESLWGGAYVLTADIDFADYAGVLKHKSIGTDSTVPFYGTFDGCGYTVSNLNILADTQFTGLFGYIKAATVKNVTVSGTVSSTNRYTGAVVGYAEASSIENCHNKATVNGTEYVGGVIGYIKNGVKLSGCYNSGDIVATATDVGGVVGLINGITDMSNCLSTGKIVYNNMNVGGLIGRTAGTVYVSNCYANSVLELTSGSSYTPDASVNRAFCGYSSSKNFTDCYFGDAYTFGNAMNGVSAYDALYFATLNADDVWVDLASPELKLFHDTINCDNTRGYAVALDGENEGYHAPVCYCGNEESIDIANKAKHKYDSKTGLCVACGFEAPYACEWQGHTYVAKADGVWCSICKQKVDAPAANEDVPLVLSIDASDATAGGTVTLTLSVSTAGDGFWGTRFSITAPEGFMFTDVDDSLLAGSGYFYTDGLAMVISKLGEDSTGAVLDNGYLNGEALKLTYSVNDTVVAGDYAFILTVCETIDANENYLNTATVSAEVRVDEAEDVVLGDIDGDGIVTIADALMLVCVVVNDETVENGDINGDGRIGLVDAIRILKLIVQ